MKHLLTLLFFICSIGCILGEPNVSFNMNQFKIDKDVYCIYETMTSYNRSKSSTEYDFVIQDSSILQSQESLIFQSPIWVDTISNIKMAMNNAIILYNISCELSILVDTYNLSNTILFVDSIEGDPMIYILTLHSLDYQQIDSIAKNISNGPLCQMAEPSFSIFSPMEHSITPEQNALFGNQWQLFNASYPLYDVNAKDAWQYTTGENVVVAVIDNGFELQHPDLASNFIQGYDCTDGRDGAKNGAYKENVDSHGTQCAGIIGAVNNDIGVVGIAPNCQLMPIRRGYSYYVKNSNGQNIDTLYHTKKEYVLKSFRQAYQNGADVISCSWSYNPSHSGIYDLVLAETVSQGRNGLGCVIVFSVGNDYQSCINYPSNTSNVIAVGASTRYGYRASFSNYGDSLDVVAPGQEVYTTQTIPYGSYTLSSGTSMACPMVAGISALILSQNPHLNWQEVRNIIRQTAYKLPYYNFDIITNNGTWNNQVGYGLVDAYAAVLAAKIRTAQINGPEILSSQSTYSVTNVPVGASIKWTYTFTPSNTHTQMHRLFDPIIFVNGDSTASVLVERGKYPAVDSMIVGPVLPPGGTILNIGNISTNDIEYRYFTGTAVLKATITSGGYSYTAAKTITLSSSSTTALALEIGEETNDIIEDNTNLLNSAPLPLYNLRHTNPISSSNAIIYIEKLLDSSNVYIPYDENYTIEIWHHQLGLIKRVCNTTSNLYLDCGDLPTGVYQMILIINGEPVAQSKLLKL